MSLDWSEESVQVAMQAALDQAELALQSGEVPVGCVFVHRDTREIVARGHNLTNLAMNATRHAELVAIDDLVVARKQDSSVLEQCFLFVTCEPCIMCAAAIATMGIKRVYFGCHNDRFGGNGSILSVHNDPKIVGPKYDVVVGVMRDHAVNVFQRFYERENKRAPEAKRRKKE